MKKLICFLSLVLLLCLFVVNPVVWAAEEFNVNEQDEDGNTAFYRAIIKGELLEIISYIEHFPDPFIENNKGENALSLAFNLSTNAFKIEPMDMSQFLYINKKHTMYNSSDPLNQINQELNDLRYDVDVSRKDIDSLQYQLEELERKVSHQNRENIASFMFSYVMFYQLFIPNN